MNKKTSSPKMSSNASAILSSNGSSKIQKSLAASVLSQSTPGKVTGKDMETKAEKETAQQLAVTRGTQAFRNFTERTNNNYIEKILEQYKQH